MPHWLSAGVIIRPSEPVSTILTEEQFNSIPTMIYQQTCPKSDHGDSRADGLDLDDAENDVDAPESVSTTVTVNAEQAEAGNVPVSLGADHEAATASTPNYATTTCTLCSICIDDFEQGESLLVLPRCLHAFHKDCIHPWLTERQGCCPLCKTNVFAQQDAASDDANTETSSRETSVAEQGHPNDNRA